MNSKYNEENTKKVQELTERLEREFARRNYLLTQCNQIVMKANREQEKQLLELLEVSNIQPIQSYVTDMTERKIIKGVFELLIERAESVIAAGWDGLGVQDLKDLAYNEYGIDMDGSHD